MAAKYNFTKDETQEAFRELFCSAEFTKEVHSELIFLSVVNTFLALTAFLGNALILLALKNETSLHPPSKLLYRCLAMTDLSVGVILQPLFVAYWMSVVNERWDICYYADLLSSVAAYFLSSVSLMTLSAISVDRLLALLLGLRYRQAVKSMYNRNRNFGPHLRIVILLESSCNHMDDKRGFNSLFNHLNFLLHENLHLFVS